MLELLYKAWHEKEKRMYPVISINLITNEVTVDTIAIGKHYKEKIPTLVYKYPKDVLLLQYIGRDDANKKKIFDGDIVRWKKLEEDFSLEKFIKNDYIAGVVMWSEEGCCFYIEQIIEGMNIFKYEDLISENYTKFYDEEGQQSFDWKNVEIIGDRFNDPYLLKSDEKQKEE